MYVMSVLNFGRVLCNFLVKRGMPECILFTLLIHFKDLIGFLASFCSVYKGPSIVFSLHPVCGLFFFFFKVFLQG